MICISFKHSHARRFGLPQAKEAIRVAKSTSWASASPHVVSAVWKSRDTYDLLNFQVKEAFEHSTSMLL